MGRPLEVPRIEQDPTHYPVDDEMGEGLLQRLIAELLRPLIARYLAHLGHKALVGANQFIYWVQHEPTSSVAPDVYVLHGVDPETLIGAWKTWETGIVPSFALEIVSRDRPKDYVRAPLRYAQLGATELIIFDPEWSLHRDAVRWQVYRRLPRRGFVQVNRTNVDGVRSKVLGAWLRVVGSGSAERIRLGVGRCGADLFPTAEEAERARTEALELEIERLRAELEHQTKR